VKDQGQMLFPRFSPKHWLCCLFWDPAGHPPTEQQDCGGNIVPLLVGSLDPKSNNSVGHGGWGVDQSSVWTKIGAGTKATTASSAVGTMGTHPACWDGKSNGKAEGC